MSGIKSQLSFGELTHKAAFNRVRDQYKYIVPSNEILRQQAQQYAALSTGGIAFPTIYSGSPIVSGNYQTYLKDFKFHVNNLNLRTNDMEEMVGLRLKETLSSLKEIQRSLLSLNSEVGEEEIKFFGNYSKVHLNAFCRGIDKPRQWADQTMLVDFKTGASAYESYLMEIIESAGTTLPTKGFEKIPIKEVYIIDEETDVGNSTHALVSNDPKNVIRKNKIFNHVIMRKEYDLTARLYKRKTSFDEYPYNCVATMTLELEMPSVVQLNYLKFEPIAGSTVTIPADGLSYRGEDGSRITLSTISISGETSTTLLFSPIRTRYLRIKFEQYATLGRKDMRIGDQQTRAINKLLESSKMTIRLPEVSDQVSGRVYDFSLSDVAVGLVSFEPYGMFRSGHSMLVDSPIGLDVKWTAEQLFDNPSGEFFSSERDDEAVEEILLPQVWEGGSDNLHLPDGNVLFESYAYVKLYGGENIAAVASGDSRLIDEFRARDTLLLDSIVPIPDSYPVQVEYLKPITGIARLKLFPDPNNYHEIEVYKNGVLLEQTFDWQMSFNAGSTYLTIPLLELEVLAALGEQYLSRAKAGDAYVSIKNFDPSEFYWIKYRVARNQKLSNCDRIFLKNGRVNFHKSLRSSSGTIDTIFIARTNSTNPYISPVLREYSLRVQEDPDAQRQSGRIKSSSVSNTKSRDTLNVS